MNFFANLSGYFPWWIPDAAYHALVRCKKGEGLLVDCGAVNNLAGDRWLARNSAAASAAGQGTSVQAIPGKSVEGVGSGTSTIDKVADTPICLQGGQIGSFKANIITDSELPALLGLESLSLNNALIDVVNQKLIFVGPGGYKLQLPPGSTSYNLEKAPSGHLLLPCSRWEERSSGHKVSGASVSL